MSNIKRLLEELQVINLPKGSLNLRELMATDFLNQRAGFVDGDWEQHVTEHGIHPSMNCHYCVQNADLPEEEVEE